MRVRHVALILVAMSSIGAQQRPSPLLGQRVRVTATDPVPRTVTGVVAAITDDTLVVMATAPRRDLLSTREAVPLRGVTQVDVRRRTYAAGAVTAALVALPAAAYGAQGTWGTVAAFSAAGAALGFVVGVAIVPSRWHRTCPGRECPRLSN